MLFCFVLFFLISRDVIDKLHGSHTNLLRLYGWVVPEVDILHVVMEKADRGLLRALQDGLPLDKRIRIALDVAEGLKAIHDIDYIYEDLKPGNILVCLAQNYFYPLIKVSFNFSILPVLSTCCYWRIFA